MVEPSRYQSYPSILRQLALAGVIVGVEASVTGLSVLFVDIDPRKWDWATETLLTLLFLAVAIPAIPYVRVACMRSRAYPLLYQSQETAALASRNATPTPIRQLLGTASVPEVPIAGSLLAGDTLSLVLSTVPDIALGRQIVCLQDSQPVGIFSVNQISDSRCAASEVQILDPLWWGGLRERAKAGDSSIPAGTRALLVPEGGFQ